MHPLNDKQLDPLLDDRGLEAHCIKNLLSEIKRWESMPNRRETITIKMMFHMFKKYKGNHVCNLDLVTCDWNVLGIFHGFRLCEW